ncbi:MAG: HGGxSTG domain-containing protein [Rhizobiaceae bacterium]
MKRQKKPVRLFAAPRCTAHSKRSGEPCRNPAVRDWTVCRLHGARGGRPITTGMHTEAAVTQRRETSALLKECRRMLSHQ